MTCIGTIQLLQVQRESLKVDVAGGHDLTTSEMKATLQYLSDGTRGFYMRVVAASDGQVIQVGDEVHTV